MRRVYGRCQRAYAGVMPNVSVNGVDLYFEEHGKGLPIVGIHGTPSSAVLWAEAAPELAKYGRCILYDRRGFYRSAPPNRSTAWT